MSVSTYYLSKTKEGKFGSVFFLKQLQESDSSGGGQNLLGSMVQWIDDNGPIGIGIGGSDYAIPQCMSTPKALIKELDKRKAELGIDGTSTLQIKVSASKETIKLEKKVVFDLETQKFKGSKGEQDFLKRYSSRGATKIEDCPEYDFIIDGDKKVELKTDFYENSPNFFMEHYSELGTKKLGGVFRAKEDGINYFVYYFIKK